MKFMATKFICLFFHNRSTSIIHSTLIWKIKKISKTIFQNYSKSYLA